MHAHPTPGATVDLAQIFRRFAPAYRARHPLADEPARVLRDVEHCRTPALGGHLYRCPACRRQVVLYNSCLNRHCPTCQGPAQYRWIAQRRRRLLPTPYFHVVFTLPAILRPVVAAHRRAMLALLFRAVSHTLLTLAADPRWLGGQPAFTLVLHTWTRALLFHPHLHAIVAAGALSPDGTRWIDAPRADFLFPVAALSKVFRGKFLDGFIALWQSGALDLSARAARRLVRAAKTHDWVVFAKAPFGGPAQIVRYLGRYTHRVGIASSRLVSITDETIVFRTRGANTCAVTPAEFIRRFLLHVLPRQFFKIRHFGLLAPANVNTRLLRAQALLRPAVATAAPRPPERPAPAGAPSSRAEHRHDTTHVDDTLESEDRSAPACPHCGARLVPLTPRRAPLAHGPPPDT